MPRNRQDVPREERVEQLLEIAQQHFVAKGYAATSVATIARAAGIEPGSVYWYFRSKDAAFAAVLDRLLDVDRVAVEASGADPGERFLAAVAAYETRADLHVCATERGRTAEAVARCRDRRLAWLLELAGDALRARGGGSELAATAVVAAVHGAVVGGDPGAAAGPIARLLLDSLATVTRARRTRP